MNTCVPVLHTALWLVVASFSAKRLLLVRCELIEFGTRGACLVKKRKAPCADH